MYNTSRTGNGLDQLNIHFTLTLVFFPGLLQQNYSAVSTNPSSFSSTSLSSTSTARPQPHPRSHRLPLPRCVGPVQYIVINSNTIDTFDIITIIIICICTIFIAKKMCKQFIRTFSSEASGENDMSLWLTCRADLDSDMRSSVSEYHLL